MGNKNNHSYTHISNHLNFDMISNVKYLQSLVRRNATMAENRLQRNSQSSPKAGFDNKPSIQQNPQEKPEGPDAGTTSFQNDAETIEQPPESDNNNNNGSQPNPSLQPGSSGGGKRKEKGKLLEFNPKPKQDHQPTSRPPAPGPKPF